MAEAADNYLYPDEANLTSLPAIDMTAPEDQIVS